MPLPVCTLFRSGESGTAPALHPCFPPAQRLEGWLLQHLQEVARWTGGSRGPMLVAGCTSKAVQPSNALQVSRASSKLWQQHPAKGRGVPSTSLHLGMHPPSDIPESSARAGTRVASTCPQSLHSWWESFPAQASSAATWGHFSQLQHNRQLLCPSVGIFPLCTDTRDEVQTSN